jgi:hypothetical protein
MLSFVEGFNGKDNEMVWFIFICGHCQCQSLSLMMLFWLFVASSLAPYCKEEALFA